LFSLSEHLADWKSVVRKERLATGMIKSRQ